MEILIIVIALGCLASGFGSALGVIISAINGNPIAKFILWFSIIVVALVMAFLLL